MGLGAMAEPHSSPLAVPGPVTHSPVPLAWAAKAPTLVPAPSPRSWVPVRRWLWNNRDPSIPSSSLPSPLRNTQLASSYPPNPNWEELGASKIGASILTGPSWGLGRDPPTPRVTSCPSVPAQACGGWEQHLLSCPMVQTGQRPPARTGRHPLLFPSLSCPKEALRNLGRFFPEGRNSHDQDLLAPRHSRHLTALHGGRVLVP